MKNNILSLKFTPSLPTTLIKEDDTICTTFLSNIKVKYHFNRPTKETDVTPLNSTVEKYVITYKSGAVIVVNNTTILKEAEDIRKGEVESIEAYITCS
ncbi:hypothetical protein AN639_08735 [Candidatus Epulonipiscium fishelsonii]|nr:hypothetical protein AN639_08735 [Epulopiscium sp. SCG-B05WGA-EpuloA1]